MVSFFHPLGCISIIAEGIKGFGENSLNYKSCRKIQRKSTRSKVKKSWAKPQPLTIMVFVSQ
jgi:hypothetical protein